LKIKPRTVPRPCPRTLFAGGLVLLMIGIFHSRTAESIGYLNLSSREPLFIGDEPKYLRMTYSLAKDGDVDLSDLIVTPEEKIKIQEEAKRIGSHGFADLYVVGVHGGIYPIHLPGFPAFIALPFKVDYHRSPPDPKKSSGGLPFLPQEMAAVRIWLLASAALIIWLLFRLLDHILKSLLLAGISLILFILWSPFPGYAFQMYPEMTAALCSLLAFNAFFVPFSRRWMNDIALVAGISALPWLHQRYIPLAAGLFLGLIIFRKRARMTAKRIMFLGLCLAVLSVPYFYYFYSITGNPSPMSPTKMAFGGSFASWKILPLGFFGQVFHREWGMLWAYPWFILVLFGLYVGFRKERSTAWALVTVLGPYYLMCSAAMPWTGIAYPPGRFLVAVFPFFAVFAGFAVRDLIFRPRAARFLVLGVWLVLIALNEAFTFAKFDFGLRDLTGRELGRIAVVLALLISFYGGLFLSEKSFRRKEAAQNVPG
jgi:hypothetical protein